MHARTQQQPILSVRRAVTLLMFGAALTLGACGDADPPAEPTPAADTAAQDNATATPDEAAEPTVEPIVDEAADKEVARAALLTLDDFPSGWTEADDPGETNQNSCPEIEDAKAAVSARASSPSFSEDTAEVTNTVYVFPDEDAAREAYAGITSAETRACIGDRLAENLDERDDVSAGDPSTGRLSVDPLGDEREAARIAITASAQGVDVEVTADVVYVRVSRAIALNVYLNQWTEFDDTLREDLTGKVARRLSAAVS
jgi:hypothetical protein